MKKNILWVILLTLVVCYGKSRSQAPLRPMSDPVDTLTDILWNRTSCRNLVPERVKAMEFMQQIADSCSNTYFNTYYRCTDMQECARMEESGILRFHKKAFDKIYNEIPETKVKKGTVVIWQLYNMGYIVKTATHCFGIDIKHKYGDCLAGYMDFLLITHKHGDHYTDSLIEAMERSNKPVISNFVDNDYKIEAPRTIVWDDMEITASLADHNKKLPDFVVTYQIDCGKSADGYTIFHSGDTYNADQLNPTRPVDLFIPHLAVGLDMFKAVEKINPETVFMSHILELGHPVDKWRWSYQYGIDRCRELKRKNVYLPVWGEKMIMP